MMGIVYCSTHKIKMFAYGGSSHRDTYSSSYVCSICGERKRRNVDLTNDTEKIEIITPGEERIHYIRIDQEMIIRLAACDDCGKNHYICMKKKTNGIKAPFCPGHKKFIRSWDRVTWVKAPLDLTANTLEIRGVIL